MESWGSGRMLASFEADGVVTRDLSTKKRDREETFSRGDILRRMEEDRERVESCPFTFPHVSQPGLARSDEPLA